MTAPSSLHALAPADLPPLDLNVVQFWATRDHRMAMIEYGPEPGGFGTIWSSADLGEGSGTIGLLAANPDGKGTTDFVQFWQNGSAIGAIGYGRLGDRPGYHVSFGQHTVLAPAEAGTFVAGRWRDGRSWIVRCSPSGSAGSELQLFTPSPNGDGLALAWRRGVGIADTQVLSADIDGDGEDELLLYSATPQRGTNKRLLTIVRVSASGSAVQGFVALDEDFFPVTAALAAAIFGDKRQAVVFLREQPATAQVRASVCFFDADLPSKYRMTVSTVGYDASGDLIGWLAVEANRGDAVDLVRFGRSGDQTTSQVFRSETPGQFMPGPLASSGLPSTAVALLQSSPGPTGRPPTRSVIHYLFDFNGRLAWALFAPNGAGTGLNLIGFQADMRQGPGAIDFFIAKTPAGPP
jgi:hypothetical protein